MNTTAPHPCPSRSTILGGGSRSRPEDDALQHAGDTYTILLSGSDTAGRFTLIDMLVPPGGGPPPHRHDFEETLTILEGEIEVTFRGVSTLVTAGDTVSVPAVRAVVAASDQVRHASPDPRRAGGNGNGNRRRRLSLGSARGRVAVIGV